jgi:hypothetical protein
LGAFKRDLRVGLLLHDAESLLCKEIKTMTNHTTLSDTLRAGNNRFPHLIFTRSQNMHLFFVESGLLVLDETINRLNLVKALLQAVEQTHDIFGDNINVASSITFDKLNRQILDELSAMEIPLELKSESPFRYNFLYRIALSIYCFETKI